MRFIRPGFSIVVLILCALPAGATDVRVTADAAPAVLAHANLPDGVSVVAISPDGLRMAYAVASAKQGLSDLVWIESSEQTGAANAVALPGTIRDLVFLEDNKTLAGLQYRAAKKRQGDTFLFTWGGEPKIKRIMRVPPSSNDLDRWPGGNAILLACRNEIRTILPPDFRSGPLFSFPGDNFAVTSLGNSSYVVVGQTEGLFLLDLSVPSGRESMPVLARQAVPAQVAALADYPAGDEVLVRLIDGRLFRASFDAPGFEQIGTADLIAGLAKAANGPFLPFAAIETAEVEAKDATAVEPVPAVVSQVIEEPAEPEPEEAPAGEPEADPEPEEAPAGDPEADPEPEQVPAEEPEAEAEPEEAPAEEPEAEPEEVPAEAEAEPAAEPEETPAITSVEPEPKPEPAPKHQIEGRIVGTVELVQAVVLLGPDNILREAARVQPDQDGTWRVDGLDPGRYRIQLDGGGDRVLVTEPRFLMVDVGETPTRAPEIKAVRSF